MPLPGPALHRAPPRSGAARRNLTLTERRGLTVSALLANCTVRSSSSPPRSSRPTLKRTCPQLTSLPLDLLCRVAGPIGAAVMGCGACGKHVGKQARTPTGSSALLDDVEHVRRHRALPHTAVSISQIGCYRRTAHHVSRHARSFHPSGRADTTFRVPVRIETGSALPPRHSIDDGSSSSSPRMLSWLP
jgi:hypothetical protein